ncbi:tryptophan synthase subunit alpha [Scatolibacter rhodanostii]|uniref:tryptophan synthase subunit alpha n=1 Tax=Scatolibacter rhodanostii TaxID=2014781 RepID=UPI000C08282F|nr:tryptophan synthase subunit alpha [Scatolibacter rhodanostii]
MSNIEAAFAKKKAFVTYLMAGDPNIEQSAEYILALQEGGADLIEIGIPFSDPVAEGEVIQKASERALLNGTTLEHIFTMLESLKGKVHVPLVLMTYLNPVFVYGYERFFARSQTCGISGIIIPDLPFEEQNEVKQIAINYGIDTITLIAPTSQERIAKIAKEAEGFVYLVSSMGVTGVRSEITTNIKQLVQEIKKGKDIPVAVGFGIATAEQAEEYAKMADGVIVGSAIVKQIAENLPDTSAKLIEYAQKMKAAISK